MNSEIKFYAKLLSRRLPAMAVIFILCTCMGLVMALRLPTLYKTSAKLLVESSQIPENMVRSTIQVNASEQLQLIEQRLMTRANLIEIAREAGVFPNQSQMNPDDIVREMRAKTGISRSAGRNRATLMTLSFSHTSPRTAAAVVNQYVTRVLATSSDFRAERAEGTLEFFRQEVSVLSQNLDLQSAKIVQFKNDNADALPENLEYRLGRQSLLQERLARAERDLELLLNQRASIQRIYDTTGTVANIEDPSSPEEQQLQLLQVELRQALSVYSDQNPRVKILRSRIERLQEQIVDIAASQTETEDDVSLEETARLSALDLSLTELATREEALQQEIETTTSELAQLEESVSRTPANRIALAAMERELENVQRLYTVATQNLADARMGERIELSSRGERVTVLEPASVPTSPSSPNRPVIVAMGVMMGGGLSLGLFVLLEILNSVIRRPTDIVSALGITPLATLPRFETVADRRNRRLKQIGSLALAAVLVPVALWAVDTYYMPVDILFEKIIRRLT